jgi:hypothetical protein
VEFIDRSGGVHNSYRYSDKEPLNGYSRVDLELLYRLAVGVHLNISQYEDTEEVR